MAKRITVCNESELSPGQGKHVEIEGKAIAVFNVDGDFYAIGGECTHQGGPLGEGDLMDTEVECPWHGATFDVTSGAVLGMPATESVPSYDVVIEGGEVKIELPD